MATDAAMAVGVAELVERARQGDQVATAQLVDMRADARKGLKRAQAALKLALRYVREHPVLSPIGAEHVDALSQVKSDVTNSKLPSADLLSFLGRHPKTTWGAIILLADGPLWTPETVAEVGATAIENPKEQELFFAGVMYCGSWPQLRSILMQVPPFARKFGEAGRVVGKARQLQIVRNGGPLTQLVPAVSWELD